MHKIINMPPKQLSENSYAKSLFLTVYEFLIYAQNKNIIKHNPFFLLSFSLMDYKNELEMLKL